MGRKKTSGQMIGVICILLGVVILFSLVLPVSFWWFLLGVGLIGLGIVLLHRCR